MEASPDVVIRSAGLGIGLALMLVLAVRGDRRCLMAVIVLVACASGYLACSAPGHACRESLPMLPLLIGAIVFPFAFWRFARAALTDRHDVPLAAWLAGVALFGSGLLVAFGGAIPSTLNIAGSVVNKACAFGFVGLALWDTWRSWDGDLVEPRRRLRWALLAYVGGYGLVVLVSEVALRGQQPPAWLDLVNAAMITLTLLASLVLLLQPSGRAVEALIGHPATPSDDAAAPPEPTPPEADQDVQLLARLHALMEGESIYRDPDLTVARLAARATVPEYVLRRLIHDRLGHRNFASYVNSFRLQEVASRLQDPELARRPVLTLALEAGFGSIGPFNRAFKERHGVTPTEFRTGNRG